MEMVNVKVVAKRPMVHVHVSQATMDLHVHLNVIVMDNVLVHSLIRLVALAVHSRQWVASLLLSCSFPLLVSSTIVDGGKKIMPKFMILNLKTI